MAAAAARLSSRLVSFSLAPSVAGKTRLSDLNVKSRGPSLSKARKLNAGTERKRKSPLNNELTSRLAGEFLVVIGEPVTPNLANRRICIEFRTLMRSSLSSSSSSSSSSSFSFFEEAEFKKNYPRAKFFVMHELNVLQNEKGDAWGWRGWFVG